MVQNSILPSFHLSLLIIYAHGKAKIQNIYSKLKQSINITILFLPRTPTPTQPFFMSEVSYILKTDFVVIQDSDQICLDYKARCAYATEKFYIRFAAK